MAVTSGVNFFVNFYDLDPFTQSQCIYFTKKGARCRWDCHENARAQVLHQRIAASSSENLSTEDIIEYLLCNCCTYSSAIDPFPKVEHREYIEDAGLIIPLAKRWRAEILARLRMTEASTQVTRSPSTSIQVPTLLDSSPASTTYSASVASTPNRDSVTQTPITDPSYYNTRNSLSREQFLASPSPQVCSTPTPRVSGVPAISKLFGTQVIEDQSPYRGGSVEESAPIERTSSLEDRYSQPPEGEFRPHKARPSPNDTVSWIMRREPQRRDNESGMLYIFDREGSPGHVKIGWTAISVQQRLEDWSNHGYTPRLVFETERVPNAQRIETLVHYELITEWRRELRCRNPFCDVKHQEWFEVSPEKAKKVVGDWVWFCKKADPFDSSGFLKDTWMDRVNKMEEKGQVVTSATLLALASLYESVTFLKDISQSPAKECVKQEPGVEEPASVESKNLTDITQVIQAALEGFKKESLLAQQEFMKRLRSEQDEFMRDLRSMQNQFMERLKPTAVTVQKPEIVVAEAGTAKPSVSKRRIRIRLPKPKESEITVKEESDVSVKEKGALSILQDSKPLSELCQKGPTSATAAMNLMDETTLHNVTEEEKSTTEAQPCQTKPASEGFPKSEFTFTRNFTRNDFMSDASSFAKVAQDTKETSAKTSLFGPLPPFRWSTSESKQTSLGASPTPEFKTSLGAGTMFAQDKRLFGEAATTGTEGLFGESTTKTSLFSASVTSTGGSRFVNHATSAGSSIFDTLGTSHQGSSVDAKAASVGKGLFDTKMASGSLSGASVTSTGGSLFGVKSASAGNSVSGSKSTSGNSLFSNKTTSTVGSLFGTSTAAEQSSLFDSKTPYVGNSVFGTKATPASSESPLSSEAASAVAPVSSSSLTAQSTSEQTSLFSTPSSTKPSDIPINTSAQSMPSRGFKTPLEELASINESLDAMLAAPKTPSTFDSQARVELDGFTLDTNSRLSARKHVPTSQQLLKDEPVQCTETVVEKEATEDITTLEPSAIPSVSETPISLPIKDSQQHVDAYEWDNDQIKEECFVRNEINRQGLAEQAQRGHELKKDNINEESETWDPHAGDIRNDSPGDQNQDKMDPDEKEESLEGNRIDQEDVNEECVSKGGIEDDIPEGSNDKNQEEEHFSKDGLSEDVGSGEVGHEDDDQQPVQQARSSSEQVANSHNEATVVSGVEVTISEKQAEYIGVILCEVKAVDGP